jgi:G3E family GTPase
MAGFSAKSRREEENSVTDLLVSQTETADLVVLNKVDLVDDAQLNQLREIVAALNPRAKVVTTSYGQLPIKSVLAIAVGQGVAMAGAVDDHRDYVTAAITSGEVVAAAADKTIELMTADCTEPDCTDPMHSHSHVAHDHDCAEPDCTDASHSHSHDAHAHDCAEPDCTDASHSHDAPAQDCAEPDCTDSSHSHAHNDNSCEDPVCTDTSHSHSHNSHAAAPTTQNHAGIGTFVYKARRPFHPGRLVSFLHNLPVVRGIPESMDEEQANNRVVIQVSADAKETLKSCLRSKGFIWCADSHTSAMYWSQAGSSFELSCLGSWWATLPRNQWPMDVNDYVLQDFDNVEHCDATNPVGVGDRRQEVVFIGQRFGSADCQMQIRDTLNQCLLDDKEYEDYKSIQSEESQLQTRFANVIETKVATY